MIECESDRIIKTDLKKRVYSQSGEITRGSWIYFKNDKKWEGPVKVTTKDGKLLYAIRAGRLLTINADQALISKVAGVLLAPDKDDSEKDNESRNQVGEEEKESPDGGKVLTEGSEP